MTMIETSAGEIACFEQGEGFPLVLLASGAHDHHDFDELIALLPDRFRTITLDWPGHGASPAGRSAASVTQFADLAEEVVERLAPGGAIVLGNSVGGFSAARMAIRRPDLVRGLVIVDGGGFAGRPAYVRIFCRLMGKPRFLRWIYPSFARRYMRPQTVADRRVLDVAVATTRADPGLSAVAALWRSFASPAHDLRTFAPSIKAPTLLIWGRHDPVIPLKLGRRAAAAIPNAQLTVLDTGHVPQTSNPVAFANLLIPFADSVFTPTSA